MIEIQHLHTGYGQHVVARDINATLHSGELTCLLGPNGVGKSTLLRTLSNFQPALQGDILVDGRSLWQLDHAEQSRLISVVLTERPDVPNMSAREMVAMGRSPYTNFWGGLQTEDERMIDQSLEMTGTTSLQHRLFSTLSDGEKQKVMIAKALAQQTKIILLDEPTAFLDFPSKVEMMRMLLMLAHEMKKIIFLSTHDVEMALQLSDKLWLLSADEVVIGSPCELAQEGMVSRFFECDGVHFDSKELTLKVLRTY